MRILRIYLEEQWLVRYYVIKHLTLQKIQNMKVKYIVPWTYDLNGEEIIGSFYDKELKKNSKRG